MQRIGQFAIGNNDQDECIEAMARSVNALLNAREVESRGRRITLRMGVPISNIVQAFGELLSDL